MALKKLLIYINYQPIKLLANFISLIKYFFTKPIHFRKPLVFAKLCPPLMKIPSNSSSEGTENTL